MKAWDGKQNENRAWDQPIRLACPAQSIRPPGRVLPCCLRLRSCCFNHLLQLSRRAGGCRNEAAATISALRSEPRKMTTFDKREEGFEKKFALDEEQKFKAEARRNRLLGMWAAAKLGLSGERRQCLCQGNRRGRIRRRRRRRRDPQGDRRSRRQGRYRHGNAGPHPDGRTDGSGRRTGEGRDVRTSVIPGLVRRTRPGISKIPDRRFAPSGMTFPLRRDGNVTPP